MHRTAVVAAQRMNSCLVIAEHDSVNVSQSTLAAVSAAQKIGGSVTLLVAGAQTAAVAQAAASISGVAKVLTVTSKVGSIFCLAFLDEKNDMAMSYMYLQDLEKPIAENMASLVVELAPKYTHVLAPSSNSGKNFIPRAAALLDSAPLTDVSAVVDASTFKRPMYAGNAIATVKMNDKIKVCHSAITFSRFLMRVCVYVRSFS